jgi:hypothetical protein
MRYRNFFSAIHTPARFWVIFKYVFNNFIFAVHTTRTSSTLRIIRNANNWRRCVDGRLQHLLRCKQVAYFSDGSQLVDGELQAGNIAWKLVSTALALLSIPGFGSVQDILLYPFDP